MTVSEVDNAANWRAADLGETGSWRRVLTDEDVGALDAALRQARSRNPSLDLSRLGPGDFPLEAFAAEIPSLRDELVSGRGFRIYEGFPVERYDTSELRAIWWGLSRHIGTPVSQSKRGDLIGDVRDIGTGIMGKEGRGYTSNAELNFHCDAADVTGLFFLKTARSGGVSRIASSVATHNEIARRRPDLLETLYQPLAWSWQGNQPPGQPGWYSMPVYGRVGDDLACAFVRVNILNAEKNGGAPPMTPEQIEAVEFVARVAAEPGMYLERMFEPGTLAFFNNNTVFHMRTEFEDWEEPEKRRHLLRIWLSLPNSRPLPESFATFWGDVRGGAVRGGYPSQADRPVFETA